MSDAPPSIRHNSYELAPAVTMLDMAPDLSRKTRDRVLKAELALGVVRYVAIAAIGEPRHAHAVAVRKNARLPRGAQNCPTRC